LFNTSPRARASGAFFLPLNPGGGKKNSRKTEIFRRSYECKACPFYFGAILHFQFSILNFLQGAASKAFSLQKIENGKLRMEN
jgi:hypothetical protein